MIYDWQNNREQRTPDMPNGVVSLEIYPSEDPLMLRNRLSTTLGPLVLLCCLCYPRIATLPKCSSAADQSTAKTGTSTLGRPALKLESVANVLECDWTTLAYRRDGQSNKPMSRESCRRLCLPLMAKCKPRTYLLLPKPDPFLSLFVGGAKTGLSGYDNAPDRVGSSNADNPVLYPSLYDPNGPSGQRFSSNFPSSRIARMYHSSATLLPDGRIMIAGSNPVSISSGQRRPS